MKLSQKAKAVLELERVRDDIKHICIDAWMDNVDEETLGNNIYDCLKAYVNASNNLLKSVDVQSKIKQNTGSVTYDNETNTAVVHRDSNGIPTDDMITKLIKDGDLPKDVIIKFDKDKKDN